MSSFLIAYASKRGHTAKIAEFAELVLTKQGHTAHLLNLAEHNKASLEDLDIPVDATILAGALTFKRHPKALIKFVKTSRNFLNAMPCLVLTSGFMDPDLSPEHRARAESCKTLFKKETGLAPTRIENIAGALPFQSYGFFTKIMMMFMLKKFRVKFDPHGTMEYTKWNTLERIVSEFSHKLNAQKAV